MFKKISTIVLLSVFTQISFAQRNQSYTLTIIDPNTKITEKIRAQLTAAFNLVYPAFARADGYGTKRDVTLEINDASTESMIAEAGKIMVNSSWLADNSAKLERELRFKLSKNWVSSDTLKKKGYQLIFISKDPNLNQTVKQNLIATYFKVYPKLVKIYNRKSTKEVFFVVDTAYRAVAEASGGRILFSAAYMKAHPTDIDVVTHETMHIVQGYGYGAGPVWLTEGIADYARYKYGVDNIGSKWSLPAYKQNQSYTNSYRITARFFAWLEKNVKSGIIATLDSELRDHQYTENSWVSLTGKSIKELWSDYSKNPEIKLTYSGK